MKKNKFTEFLSSSLKKMNHYSPEIAGGMALVGLGLTVWETIKATKKAEKKLSECNKELTKKEKLEMTWKYYIPAASSAAITASCIIFSTKKNFERKAALMTAYKISETALTDYKKSVLETYGEKQANAITDKVNQMQIDREPVRKDESNVVITKQGNHLCYDYLGRRYFRSDVETIRKIVNDLNMKLSPTYKYGGWESVSLNDFYDAVGLEGTKIGENLIWTAEDGGFDVTFTAAVADDDHTPCLVVNFNPDPEYWDKY